VVYIDPQNALAFAMLDVKNAHLHAMKSSPNPRLPLLLRGEAASFSTIYAGT
jgi:hypothetical protein